jgi:hypothetical protein
LFRYLTIDYPEVVNFKDQGIFTLVPDRREPTLDGKRYMYIVFHESDNAPWVNKVHQIEIRDKDLEIWDITLKQDRSMLTLYNSYGVTDKKYSHIDVIDGPRVLSLEDNQNEWVPTKIDLEKLVQEGAKLHRYSSITFLALN